MGELAEAAVIDITSTTVKPFEVGERLFDPKGIIETLSGLISVTESADHGLMIRLAHFSVEEYLVSERIKTSPASSFQLSLASALQSLASGCHYYLLSFDFHQPERHYWQEPTLMKFPLLKYAANHWYEYVKECQRPTPEWLMDVILKFLRCKKSVQLFRLSWDMRYKMEASDRVCFRPLRKTSRRSVIPTIYHACYLGMAEVVQRCLNMDMAKCESVQAQNSPVLSRRYADELRAASYHGHKEITRRLCLCCWTAALTLQLSAAS